MGGRPPPRPSTSAEVPHEGLGGCWQEGRLQRLDGRLEAGADDNCPDQSRPAGMTMGGMTMGGMTMGGMTMGGMTMGGMTMGGMTMGGMTMSPQLLLGRKSSRPPGLKQSDF